MRDNKNDRALQKARNNKNIIRGIYIGDILFCKNGETVVVKKLTENKIEVEYKNKLYSRDLSLIGETLFKQPFEEQVQNNTNINTENSRKANSNADSSIVDDTDNGHKKRSNKAKKDPFAVCNKTIKDKTEVLCKRCLLRFDCFSVNATKCSYFRAAPSGINEKLFDR